MRTRKRRKSWSPVTLKVCHHDHQQLTSNTSYEKLPKCQQENLEHCFYYYCYCHNYHTYCLKFNNNQQYMCNNLTKSSNPNLLHFKHRTKSFRKLTNLIDTFTTLLYLSTCFLLLYNDATNPSNSFRPLSAIQLVSSQRLPKLSSSSSIPQLQPFLPKPPSSSSYNSKTNLPDIIVQQGGVIKDKNVTLTRDLSPILITKDIVIKKDAKLTIESGTELLFERQKGITVHGVLDILGTSENRVKLNLLKSKKSATVNYRSHTNNLQQVRLVDGDLPSEGRVQIKLNDRWHSLCTNSKNLTAADIKVICQQAGYQEGYWYKWFPKRNGTTFQIMSKSFHCTGNEATLSQCQRWNRLRAGGGVCDYQSDIGIRCSKSLVFGPQSGFSYDYWKGIEFINGESIPEYVLEGQMKRRISMSNLRYLSISDAGQNSAGNATAAIRVLGQPPKMNNIEVKNSIYGIVIEDTEDAFDLSNIRLSNNLGYPLFINTSWGKISLDNLHIENNGGDGVRVVRHEKVLVGAHDFCRFANLGSSQSFPVILSHEQTFFTSGRECCQEFVSNNQLTVHFPVLRSTPNNLLPESDNNRRITIPAGVSLGKDANLVIYDDYRDEFPFKFSIRNSTRVQSIVSKSGRLKICYEPASYRTVLFTVEIVADKDDEWSGAARDVEISNSFISNNEGRGIWIDNQRSGVKLMNTTVINHNYLSGVHLENGTGEVIIQGCNISHNIGHGLLINLAGGYYHIDNSTISDNSLKGILIEYDKRPELIPFNHTMHVGYSLIARNGENGIFIGNVCRSDAFWNISMNSIIENREDAIYFHSCLPNPETVSNFRQLSSRLNLSDPHLVFHNNFQELTISHNIFMANFRRAVRMSPVFFVKSFIRHNSFRDHQLAVLHISNQGLSETDIDYSPHAPVNIRVASNRFYSNQGRYVVNIGVQEDNPKHSLVFTKNTLENNFITEPYNDLKPRSRVSAVLVVSSSNTRVIRNRFDNPQSNFDLGCHLESHSKVINATANFWGYKLDAASIYRRIFDRKNRFNLAQVEFLQYLMSPEDLEYASDLSFDRERDKISTFRNGLRLGGEVKGYEDLPADTYIVHDDIFVRPGSHLILRPGTVLKFQDSVGIMVQGRLDAIGQASSQIVFTSAMPSSRLPQRAIATTTPLPKSNTWVSYQPDDIYEEENESRSRYKNSRSSPSEKISNIKKRQVINSNTQNIRLSHTTMGRLEVQLDGVWGSVCDYNFDIEDAAVACQQLGMVINRKDWLLEKFQYTSNDQHQLSMIPNTVLMTNLQCDPTLDADFTKCKAETSLKGDFDGICNSEVGIKCFPPSWSGIRLGMGADISTLNHAVIQRAGMFDYASYDLKPALQIDLNRHWISSINVKSNSDSGIGIGWTDVIGRHYSELAISDSKFLNNERHGIELKTRGFTIRNCLISNNRQHGIDYNPSFTQKELSDLMSWLYTNKNSENVVTLTVPLQSKYISVPSSEDSYRIFIFQKNPQPDLNETFIFTTDLGHMLSIHLLNPIHPESTESLNMSLGTNPDSPIWDLRLNMTSFPMVSPGYKFHFNYSTGRKPRGNIILYVRSRYNNRNLKHLNKFIPPHLIANKFDQTAININSKLINSIFITNSNITKNGIGSRFRHANQPFDNQFNYNMRYCNETTNITSSTFDGNHFDSILVHPDDYTLQHDLINSTLPAAAITYNVLGNKFHRNMNGIRQFNRDIRHSNNIFHWTINDTFFDYNRNGGVNIMLPYFWKYDANLSHTVEISNNTFWRNSNFEFFIGGHFAMFNLSDNTFRDNKCKSNLIAISGMEKRMLIKDNVIEQNFCGRVIEVNILSHADKMGLIPAMFQYNSIKYNRRLPTNITLSALSPGSNQSKLIKKLHPHENDYALSLRGIQPVNITRNLFVNPDLGFELVACIVTNPEEQVANAMENYWGTASQVEINERIFDFDDWNNCALINLSPYLTQDSFASASIITERKEYLQFSTNKPLGGRLTKSITIPYRKEPYLVESDLTVMPNSRLTIEKGTTLEFMPNVGILVLGELIAAGTRERPIQFRPALSAQDILPIYQYLFPPRPKSVALRVNDPLSYESSFRHYQSSFPVDMGSIRLCKNEICNDGTHIYENNVEDQTLRQEVLKNSNNTWKMDGFLEIFNMTTLQWVPICDPLFNEHTVKVVCRQLGYSQLSIHKRGRRYTIEQEQINSIKNWPDSVRCQGDESNLSNCLVVPKGSSTNHSTACAREGNQFIYVYCADIPYSMSMNSPQAHTITTENIQNWGGLRFSCPTFSTGIDIYDSRDTYNMISQTQGRSVTKSRLQYVIVDGAGMLHMKRSAAVQVFQCSVQIDYTSILNSCHHGLEYVTSQGDQNFHQLRVHNNLGVGINYLSLTGSSSTNRIIPYLPLKHLDISPDIHGMVDICGSNKEVVVEDRLLLFYKYTGQAADCLRIISSKLHIKHLGIRLLQFDLFNSTSYTARPDSLKIYDGDIFDRESRLLVDLGVTERHRLERPELKFFQTTDSTMTVRLHASDASSLHGFIAEIVTTPVSYNTQRDIYNNVTFSDITNNKLGALSMSTAGESSPNLVLKNNRFEGNCIHLFGNFTSCISPIYMELQNCQKLRLINNLIRANQGGAVVKSFSSSAVSALDAAIENNVFENNQNTNILALIGPKTDPYQSVRVRQNFFTKNFAQYASNIVLSRIVANFSHNIVSGNVGKHQIEVLGFDKLPLSYQKFISNWIYNNTATLERDRSTIVGNSAGQQYRENYLVNPDNHFEISTLNWSRYDTKPLHTIKDDEIIHLSSGDGSSKDVFRKTVDAIPLNVSDTKKLDLFHVTIDAVFNWWGFNSTAAIQNRIRDRMQHEELLKVDFVPYLATNRTVLSGICAGGWQKVNDICLVYVGARMTYQEAKDFCDRERSSLPLLRGNYYELSDFVKTQERDYDPKVDRIWVRSFDVSKEACPALNDYRTKNYDCQDRHSFLCEKDPMVVVNLLHWHRETGGLIALILAIVTLILTFCCTLCWGYKSRQMHKEKIQRRKNSVLYSSMRSNRGPYSSSNSISEQFLHRQLYNTENSSVTNLSLSTQFTQPSDSANLVRLDPGYSLSQNNHQNALDEAAYVNTRSQLFYNPQPPQNPTYVSPTPNEKVMKQLHSVANPNYDSPPIQKSSINPPVIHSNQSNSLKIIKEQFSKPLVPPPLPPLNYDHMSPIPEEQFSVPVTPAPSYREVHPRALSNGSKSPSYAGSQLGDILTDPMPLLSTTYSQINHLINAKREQQLPNYNYEQQQLTSPLPSRASNNPMRDIDDSDSTAPTYYNNQTLENYEESSQSYLESEIDAYNKALQRLNNDTTSFIITERSSTTDIYSSQLTRTSIIDSQTDLVSMRPQSSTENVDNDPKGAYHNRAYSDTASGSHRNKYYAETSLDEEPPVAPTSMFGSSQRLSPVSSSYGQQDSKQGSRVFLETSFG